MEIFSSQLISVWPFPRASPSSPWCLSDEWNQVVGRAVFRSHVCQPSTYNSHVIWRGWIHFSLSLSIPMSGHRNGVSVSLESDEKEGVSGGDISPLDHVRSVDGLFEFGDRGLQSQAQFATRHLRQVHCLFIFPSLLKILVLVRWIWFSRIPSYLRFSYNFLFNKIFLYKNISTLYPLIRIIICKFEKYLNSLPAFPPAWCVQTCSLLFPFPPS